MKYRLLGNSGLRVSEAALGTMTFGEDWGWGAVKEEARKVYDAFREAGGNFIDTANFYTNGTSESFLGEFMEGHRYKHKLLAMIDEFPALGKLEILQESLAFVAGYGIKCYLISQDINQLKSREIGYGPDETITSNCHVQTAFPPPDSRQSMGGNLFISRMKPSRPVRRSRRKSTAIHSLVCRRPRSKFSKTSVIP